MKRIGRLNGKVVVQGDPNLVTKGQILYKQQGNDIILQERKNNKLESITAGEGGNSEDSEILYYKFVDSDKPLDFNGMIMSYSEFAIRNFLNILESINIISFKVNYNNTIYHIGKTIDVTGSGGIVGDDTYNFLSNHIEDKSIIGFRLLKSENTNVNIRNNTFTPLAPVQGSIEDIIKNLLLTTIAPPDTSEEEMEQIMVILEEFYLKPIRECFVEITREEYYNL